MPNTQEVYTVDELAQRWKCSRDALYDMLRQKKLRAFKVGGHYRISAAEVIRHEAGEAK
jgi:excisionase family DNA binding protein